MLSTIIIMQSVQNFLTACGTILAHCSENAVLKVSPPDRSLAFSSSPAVFLLRSRYFTAINQKKACCRGGIFSCIPSIFYHTFFAIFSAHFPYLYGSGHPVLSPLSYLPIIFISSSCAYVINTILSLYFSCFFRFFSKLSPDIRFCLSGTADGIFLHSNRYFFAVYKKTCRESIFSRHVCKNISFYPPICFRRCSMSVRLGLRGLLDVVTSANAALTISSCSFLNRAIS